MTEYEVTLWPADGSKPCPKTTVQAIDEMHAAAQAVQDFQRLGCDVVGARKIHVHGPNIAPGEGVAIDPETVMDWMLRNPGPYGGA